jgi:hypothetical protein
MALFRLWSFQRTPHTDDGCPAAGSRGLTAMYVFGDIVRDGSRAVRPASRAVVYTVLFSCGGLRGGLREGHATPSPPDGAAGPLRPRARWPHHRHD